MADWKRYPNEKPDRAGYYLVLYEGDNNGDYIGACVEKYYMEGDFIDAMQSDIIGTPEERLLDSIKNRPVFVAKRGFYACGEETHGLFKHWEVKPEYWMELPDPPHGKYI